jgi:hypothetical protein
MKKLSIISAVAALASVASASDQIQTAGRAGFKHATQKEQVTVALYDSQAREAVSDERKVSRDLQTLGRAGFQIR